ncbi:hypothetical protein B9Z19DRAFT_980355 [Tuber borchii]|uniref:Uncharacterized protein n=1 Tax=Tuber borchii TaxID=42251 RepID=A0A2T6ZUN9_TUBBO|nr:hypothetical protein B9Z19DRAFT_980355 [Tuber borchii]
MGTSSKTHCEDQADTECEAILATTIEIGEEEGMRKDARKTWKKAHKEDEVGIWAENMIVTVGNQRGLQIASWLHTLKAKDIISEAKIASLQEELNSVKSEAQLGERRVKVYQGQVNNLLESLDRYYLLRNRFISTFKRDKQHNATPGDHKIINSGNTWAHGGDVVADAKLYTTLTSAHRRTDAADFKHLYGFPPPVIEIITHRETIRVLNCHAEIKASRTKKASPLFYERFETFIDLFKKSNYDQTYLQDHRSALAIAYQRFWDAHKQEVVVEQPSEKSD